MNAKQLMQAADKAHTELQNLGIQPTKTNLAILLNALQTLENVYRYLREQPAETADTGEESADV